MVRRTTSRFSTGCCRTKVNRESFSSMLRETGQQPTRQKIED